MVCRFDWARVQVHIKLGLHVNNDLYIHHTVYITETIEILHLNQPIVVARSSQEIQGNLYKYNV